MIQIHQDLDQRLRKRREWIGFGSTRPRHIYKVISTRFPSFFKILSLSSLLLSAVLLPSQTLTLILFTWPRNQRNTVLTNHVAILSMNQTPETTYVG